MTKKQQILFAILFHMLLILLGFVLMRVARGEFLCIAGFLFLTYLIFYIIAVCKERPFWILLLYHLIGSASQFLLHHFEIIPSDASWPFDGLAQYLYAYFAIPGYFALLLLTHLILFLLYLIRNRRKPTTFTLYRQKE